MNKLFHRIGSSFNKENKRSGIFDLIGISCIIIAIFVIIQNYGLQYSSFIQNLTLVLIVTGLTIILGIYCIIVTLKSWEKKDGLGLVLITGIILTIGGILGMFLFSIVDWILLSSTLIGIGFSFLMVGLTLAWNSRFSIEEIERFIIQAKIELRCL